MVHFKNLDALRFIAAFSVFIFHLFADLKGYFPDIKDNWIFDKLYVIVDKGHLGVNFFFVLSGFLITYLILHEIKYKGKFSLKNFLIRRTLRIWPLYFIVILIGFVIFPLIIDGYSTNHNPLMYVAFLANFDEINVGATDSINFLTSPWSIAVEEQFYLFWSLIFVVIHQLKKIKLIHLIIILYIGAFVFRWLYMDNERVLYYHTLAVCQDILTGAFIGLSLFEGKKWLEKLKSLQLIWVIAIYLLGLGICIAKNKIFIGEAVIFERFVLSLFFGFVILDQVRGEHSFFKFGKISVFNFLGKISYGLYMYHLIVMYLLLDYFLELNLSSPLIGILYLSSSLAVIILTSVISYYFIEKPLLKLKPH
ncbi:acyltransferase [Paracrocinitomix mangrovi]|uniref:acyltransferase family protein n=1 Tax=Paracrocinitomix mangrovi TaxID=2862509 RepID=UPI001C8D72E2|nr:acyltransferase [Paracrocinitomix mangrovi]UKN02629.1 acyltransferase [Paracrocinitomix mangrovi]